MRAACAVIVLFCVASSPVAAQSVQAPSSEGPHLLSTQIGVAASTRLLSQSTQLGTARSSTVTLSPEKPRADGLANGMWIGLVVGFAAGGVSIPIVCKHDDECQNAYAWTTVPIWGAGGAVVGALIDRHFKHYPASAGITFKGTVVRVNPMVARHQRGVTVRVDF